MPMTTRRRASTVTPLPVSDCLSTSPVSEIPVPVSYTHLDVYKRQPSTYARAVASGLVADREQTLELLRRSGVETLDADARTLSPRLVNRYLELKRSSRL